MEIPWRVISGEGEGENGGKGTGNKKHKRWGQNRQGEVKNSIGNGEAKELTYMIHGYELRRGTLVAGGCTVEGNKGEKKWDNCNSIINKIYLKKNYQEKNVNMENGSQNKQGT